MKLATDQIDDLKTGAFLGAIAGIGAVTALAVVTLQIRRVYGCDAPFEDFMPAWLAQGAYAINSGYDYLYGFLGNLFCLARLVLTGDYTGYNGPLFGLNEDHWLWTPFYWLHQVVFKGAFNPYY